MSLSEINIREKKFHNQLHESGSHRYENRFYRALNALYDDFFNTLKKEVNKKNVLDYGCGVGSYTERVIKFNPSKITAIDISEKAINIAKEKKNDQNHIVDYRVENCESTKLNSNEYDLIYGAGILHHLDLKKSLNELNRLIGKNGTIIFIEPLGTNPIINLYRKLTPRARSSDEHPLSFGDINFIKDLFDEVDIKYYGFFTLVFLPFYKSTKNSKFFSFLSQIDRIFLKIPLFRFLAWSILIKAKKN